MYYMFIKKISRSVGLQFFLKMWWDRHFKTIFGLTKSSFGQGKVGEFSLAQRVATLFP